MIKSFQLLLSYLSKILGIIALKNVNALWQLYGRFSHNIYSVGSKINEERYETWWWFVGSTKLPHSKKIIHLLLRIRQILEYWGYILKRLFRIKISFIKTCLQLHSDDADFYTLSHSLTVPSPNAIDYKLSALGD